jgi:type IV secretion system protein VirB1
LILPALIAACAPGVHPATMAEIVRVESAGNPLAIHVNGWKGPQPSPSDTASAVRIATQFIAAGYSVDLGPMQVNSANLAAFGKRVEDVLGSDDKTQCQNLALGAAILTADYRRAVARYGEGQPSLLAALSAYNTGTFDRGMMNGYVAKYISAVPLPARLVSVALRRHIADTESWG